MAMVAQQTGRSQPTIRRYIIPVRDTKGVDHAIALRVRVRDGSITEVESQSEPGGYEWAGYSDHRCEYLDNWPTRTCRHIQAVRQYEANRRAS